MRFAFITTMQGLLPWGGSEELWSQAASRLKFENHDVRAFVMYRPQLCGKLAQLVQHGVALETYPSPTYLVSTARYIWTRASLGYRRAYRKLKQFHPDLVVISQGNNIGGFNWAKICRDAAIPYVIIVQCNSELWWFEEKDVGDAAESYTGALRVFCVSRSNLDLLRLQVGDELRNGEVVWNPYNVSVEQPPAWPDESGGWRLACVARMDLAAKGQDLLLQTLAHPRWRSRPFEVSFYGAGPHEPALRRMADMLRVNNVHFRGHVTDIRTAWEHNHILVLPSRYEGLPLALVEAMWCERPAVVTDVGGNAELCVDNETGFIAPAATVSSFGGALEQAWARRKEWAQMGQAARVRVERQVPKDPIGQFCERLKNCLA